MRFVGWYRDRENVRQWHRGTAPCYTRDGAEAYLNDLAHAAGCEQVVLPAGETPIAGREEAGGTVEDKRDGWDDMMADLAAV